MPTAVEPFRESFKWPGHNKLILFDSDSYNEWIESVLPWAADIPVLTQWEARTQGIPVGDKYMCYRRTLHKMQQLKLFRGRSTGYCGFDDDVEIPILAETRWAAPWMSLTPNEILTQRGQIRRAKKNTGMAGLGLGWAARKVLEREQVDHLTIVERDAAVIEAFGTSLKDEFGDRLTIIEGDAYCYDWSQHDVALWDIWEGWGEASDDRQFWTIKRSLESDGKTCIGWGQTVHSDHY